MTSVDIAMIMAAAIRAAVEVHPKNSTHSLDVARTACTITEHCVNKVRELEGRYNKE